MIISRASVALTETEKGHYRGFGLAGKIFPTSNAKDKKAYKTANFFTIDDLSGSKPQARNSVSDFREELLTQINEEGFVDFDISVADSSKKFKKIGELNPEVDRRHGMPTANIGKKNLFTLTCMFDRFHFFILSVR